MSTYNITNIKTISELNPVESLLSSDKFIVGNNGTTKSLAYSTLSTNLQNIINPGGASYIEELTLSTSQLSTAITDLQTSTDEISGAVSLSSESLSTAINDINDNIANIYRKNETSSAAELSEKFTKLEEEIGSGGGTEIQAATTTRIGGFRIADANSINSLTSNNTSAEAKYPIALSSVNKGQSDIAYVTINNAELTTVINTLETRISDNKSSITNLSNTYATKTTLNNICSEIKESNAQISDIDDNYDNLVSSFSTTVQEIYGDKFIRNVYLSVDFDEETIIDKLSNDINDNDTLIFIYNENEWNIVLDNDYQDVLENNVTLSNYGLSVININDEDEEYYPLSGDSIYIYFDSNIKLDRVDTRFVNNTEKNGDIGYLSSQISLYSGYSITNDYNDISNATEESKLIPTAYAINQYILHMRT